MNLEEYKRTMQEVFVDTDQVKSRFEESMVKKKHRLSNYKKPIFTCVFTAILILILLKPNMVHTENIPDITLTVYAAALDKGEILSKVPVILSTSYQFNLLAITNEEKADETGEINYDLNFKCKGENIKSITYKLSDKEITRENRNEAAAWFAENYSGYINSKPSIIDYKSLYRTYTDPNSKKYYSTKMIGSSYTVNYENQNEKHYSLEINLNADDKGQLSAKSFKITAIISFKDGSILEKHILVHPLKINPSTITSWQIEMTLED